MALPLAMFVVIVNKKFSWAEINIILQPNVNTSKKNIIIFSYIKIVLNLVFYFSQTTVLTVAL